jgi:Flp pilus assembly protein TadD
LRGKHGLEHFLGPGVPLPVEVPEGGLDAARAPLEGLTIEAALSGMLLALADGEARPDWLDCYRRFVAAARPSIMEEFTEAAIVKSRAGEWELALEILDSLRGLFPGSPAAALNRALVLERRASALERQGAEGASAATAAAEAAYREAVDLAPDLPEALLNAGFFHMDRGDFARARDLLAACAELPDGGGGKAARAEAAVREIDRSGIADARFREALALVRGGREEDGMAALRDFIEERPDVWNGWFALGWALRRLRRWADAAAALRKAMELGGARAETRNELAICLMETGDPEGARRELEAALREDCEDARTVSNLGVVSMRLGKPGEAAAFFRAALDLDPEDPVASECLRSLGEGAGVLKGGASGLEGGAPQA